MDFFLDEYKGFLVYEIATTALAILIFIGVMRYFIRGYRTVGEHEALIILRDDKFHEVVGSTRLILSPRRRVMSGAEVNFWRYTTRDAIGAKLDVVKLVARNGLIDLGKRIVSPDTFEVHTKDSIKYFADVSVTFSLSKERLHFTRAFSDFDQVLRLRIASAVKIAVGDVNRAELAKSVERIRGDALRALNAYEMTSEERRKSIVESSVRYEPMGVDFVDIELSLDVEPKLGPGTKSAASAPENQLLGIKVQDLVEYRNKFVPQDGLHAHTHEPLPTLLNTNELFLAALEMHTRVRIAEALGSQGNATIISAGDAGLSSGSVLRGVLGAKLRHAEKRNLNERPSDHDEPKASKEDEVKVSEEAEDSDEGGSGEKRDDRSIVQT